MSSNRLTKCATVQTAQDLVKFLRDKTQAWQPPVEFDMLLKPDGVHVRPALGSPLRKEDEAQIKGWVKEFVSTQKPA